MTMELKGHQLLNINQSTLYSIHDGEQTILASGDLALTVVDVPVESSSSNYVDQWFIFKIKDLEFPLSAQTQIIKQGNNAYVGLNSQYNLAMKKSTIENL